MAHHGTVYYLHSGSAETAARIAAEKNCPALKVSPPPPVEPTVLNINPAAVGTPSSAAEWGDCLVPFVDLENHWKQAFEDFCNSESIYDDKLKVEFVRVYNVAVLNVQMQLGVVYHLGSVARLAFFASKNAVTLVTASRVVTLASAQTRTMVAAFLLWASIVGHNLPIYLKDIETQLLGLTTGSIGDSEWMNAVMDGKVDQGMVAHGQIAAAAIGNLKQEWPKFHMAPPNLTMYPFAASVLCVTEKARKTVIFNGHRSRQCIYFQAAVLAAAIDGMDPKTIIASVKARVAALAPSWVGYLASTVGQPPMARLFFTRPRCIDTNDTTNHTLFKIMHADCQAALRMPQAASLRASFWLAHAHRMITLPSEIAPSAATSLAPQVGANWAASADLSAFAEVYTQDLARYDPPNTPSWTCEWYTDPYKKNAAEAACALTNHNLLGDNIAEPIIYFGSNTDSILRALWKVLPDPTPRTMFEAFRNLTVLAQRRVFESEPSFDPYSETDSETESPVSGISKKAFGALKDILKLSECSPYADTDLSSRRPAYAAAAANTPLLDACGFALGVNFFPPKNQAAPKARERFHDAVLRQKGNLGRKYSCSGHLRVDELAAAFDHAVFKKLLAKWFIVHDLPMRHPILLRAFYNREESDVAKRVAIMDTSTEEDYMIPEKEGDEKVTALRKQGIGNQAMDALMDNYASLHGYDDILSVVKKVASTQQGVLPCGRVYRHPSNSKFFVYAGGVAGPRCFHYAGESALGPLFHRPAGGFPEADKEVGYTGETDYPAEILTAFIIQETTTATTHTRRHPTVIFRYEGGSAVYVDEEEACLRTDIPALRFFPRGAAVFLVKKQKRNFTAICPWRQNQASILVEADLTPSLMGLHLDAASAPVLFDALYGALGRPSFFARADDDVHPWEAILGGRVPDPLNVLAKDLLATPTVSSQVLQLRKDTNCALVKVAQAYAPKDAEVLACAAAIGGQFPEVGDDADRMTFARRTVPCAENTGAGNAADIHRLTLAWDALVVSLAAKVSGIWDGDHLSFAAAVEASAVEVCDLIEATSSAALCTRLYSAMTSSPEACFEVRALLDPVMPAEKIDAYGGSSQEATTLRPTNLSSTKVSDLVFQAWFGGAAWPWQLEAVRNMEDQVAVRQIMMSKGKSKVITPILALRQVAAGKNPVVVVPPQLVRQTRDVVTSLAFAACCDGKAIQVMSDTDAKFAFLTHVVGVGGLPVTPKVPSPAFIFDEFDAMLDPNQSNLNVITEQESSTFTPVKVAFVANSVDNEIFTLKHDVDAIFATAVDRTNLQANAMRHRVDYGPPTTPIKDIIGKPAQVLVNAGLSTPFVLPYARLDTPLAQASFTSNLLTLVLTLEDLKKAEYVLSDHHLVWVTIFRGRLRSKILNLVVPENRQVLGEAIKATHPQERARVAIATAVSAAAVSTELKPALATLALAYMQVAAQTFLRDAATRVNTSFMDVIGTKNRAKWQTGFTGTVSYTPPPSPLEFRARPIVDPDEVFHVGTAIDKGKAIRVSNEQEIFEHVVEEQYDALIDAGATLKAYTVTGIVEALRAKMLTRPIAYVRDDDTQVVDLYKTGVFALGATPPADVFYVFTEKHTVGVDFRNQPLGSKALVALAKSTTRTQAAQAMFRMRRLNRGHTVDFALLDFHLSDGGLAAHLKTQEEYVRKAREAPHAIQEFLHLRRLEQNNSLEAHTEKGLVHAHSFDRNLTMLTNKLVALLKGSANLTLPAGMYADAVVTAACGGDLDCLAALVFGEPRIVGGGKAATQVALAFEVVTDVITDVSADITTIVRLQAKCYVYGSRYLPPSLIQNSHPFPETTLVRVIMEEEEEEEDDVKEVRVVRDVFTVSDTCKLVLFGVKTIGVKVAGFIRHGEIDYILCGYALLWVLPHRPVYTPDGRLLNGIIFTEAESKAKAPPPLALITSLQNDTDSLAEDDLESVNKALNDSKGDRLAVAVLTLVNAGLVSATALAASGLADTLKIVLKERLYPRVFEWDQDELTMDQEQAVITEDYSLLVNATVQPNMKSFLDYTTCDSLPERHPRLH